jgi:hypothetical protein
VHVAVRNSRSINTIQPFSTSIQKYLHSAMT